MADKNDAFPHLQAYNIASSHPEAMVKHSEEDCQVISHCLARGYYLDALNYSSATGALAAILHLLYEQPPERHVMDA